MDARVAVVLSKTSSLSVHLGSATTCECEPQSEPDEESSKECEEEQRDFGIQDVGDHALPEDRPQRCYPTGAT